MTIVLVHGVPETATVWDPLVQSLDEAGFGEPVRLSPPGFGVPTPDRWPATMTSYRDWLIFELEQIGEPVHLVGHDWGGGHVVNVAMARPDLLRTWTSDAVGLFDPGYVWHPLARTWQTPDAGEQAVATLIELPAGARADNLVEAGMTRGIADRVAERIDAAMGECILRLYRSAAQPALAEAGAHLEAAAARPGLALLCTEDHNVGTDDERRNSASRAGAQVHVLQGLGHWWMTHDPRQAATVLTEFWRNHDR